MDGSSTSGDEGSTTPLWPSILLPIVVVAWAGICLNLLGAVPGIIGVLVFIGISTFAWQRTKGNEGLHD